MQFKKCFALILSAFMILSSISVSVSAESATYISDEGIAPAYEYTDDAKSILYVSLNTAECTSKCTGASNVVQITVEQTLQKFWGLWIWNDVDGVSWSTTKSGSYASVVNTKSGLSSGTYRLKSVFTLTTSDGKSETITIYSDEETIGQMGLKPEQVSRTFLQIKQCARGCKDWSFDNQKGKHYED